MKISDILKEGFIIADLKAEDKTEALNEISIFLERQGIIPDHAQLLQGLLNREQLGSTGIGDNMAIPHAKSENIEEIVTVFARSPKGLDFESLDRKPVHFIFMLLAPSASTGLHLKALAKIARLFKNPSLRENILNAENAGKIYSLMLEEDSKIS
ncbi:MAG: PTS sugar transporter subunit IIA [Nitrospinota bacterium]|nr:PTS sugar transporter subunit IIA [Nitrospinota bacterium]